MIITARPRIPFLWQLLVAAPWAALNLKTMTMDTVFVFPLWKFVENRQA